MSGEAQHILLKAFVDELARCGVRHACTSPGSRSTPLVLPLVRDGRIRCWSHVDERSAGFFAIGIAKNTGLPVPLTCTSGTAAANFAPAVHEAHEAGVPLIVLTADRPPELREVGAGQVIDQIKLYGSAAKWFFEVDVADASPERVRFIRSLACRAFHTALEDRPGVVHLNFPLRDPLIPSGDVPESDPRGRADGRPWLRRTGATRTDAIEIDEVLGEDPVIDPQRRGVVVAGTGAPAWIATWAADVGWPLLADPLSAQRRGRAAIAHYDHLLRNDIAEPDLILRVGDLPTSKPLRAWLTASSVEQVLVAGPAVWNDPMGTGSVVLTAEEILQQRGNAPSDWLAKWKDADARAAEAIEATLGDALTEPQVARELGRLNDVTVWVASSMPVRDVEAFLPVDGTPVLANRGANGIDGTVSSAYGAAAAGERRVVLLIGDVALLHDIGGLLAGRRHDLDLTIVLLNNDGGGIFEFLPISGEGDAYVEHIATPHGADFAGAATLFGLKHERPQTLEAFRAALDASVDGEGTTIIEVRTDRAANRALHAEVAEAVQRTATR